MKANPIAIGLILGTIAITPILSFLIGRNKGAINKMKKEISELKKSV